MAATLQATRKPRAVQSAPALGDDASEAAKLQRARQMLKELRPQIEALVISSQRTLARVRRMVPPEQ